MSQLKLIPVNKLQTGHKVTRDRELNLLMESIEEKGFLPHRALIVVEENNGMFSVLDGRRRYFAAVELKMEDVPCMVLTDEESKTVFG